jgi:hypothetical protein
MTPTDPDPRTRYGFPSIAAAAEAKTQAAIRAYRAYRADPLFVPAPSTAQVRLVAQYCHEYISSPVFTYPAEELRQLREMVLLIVTLGELADWLWEARRIGIEPL